MALIFNRLAQNYIKDGYFPTDEVTQERIFQALSVPNKVASNARMRVFDPCCGEGTALGNLKHVLQTCAAQQIPEDKRHNAEPCESFGIELNRERAQHATQMLDRAIFADVHDVVVSPRSMSLIFLNPPYGFGVSDAAGTGSTADQTNSKAERLERTFLKKCAPLLVQGGVLVFIIPFYALDDDMAEYLARNFKRLQFFMAPEERFQQCVILGVKTRPGHPAKDVVNMLKEARDGKFKDRVIPDQWMEAPYEVPAVVEDAEFKFHAVRIEPEQFSHELKVHRHSLLWPSFGGFFQQIKSEHRRPLRDMTKWHLALALAAGQVTGKLVSKDGRILAIKGDTVKRKHRSVSLQTDADGNIDQTITMTDKFVPTINAIEFTPGERLGQIVSIN